MNDAPYLDPPNETPRTIQCIGCHSPQPLDGDCDEYTQGWLCRICNDRLQQIMITLSNVPEWYYKTLYTSFEKQYPDLLDLTDFGPP